MKNKSPFIYVTIPNWQKYNPRTDKKNNYKWFRMDNSFFQKERIVMTTNIEKVVFLYTLCARSDQNNDVTCINVSITRALLGIKSANLYKIYKSLQALGLLDLAINVSYNTNEQYNTRASAHEQPTSTSGAADAPVETGNGEPTTASLRSEDNAPLRSAEFIKPSVKKSFVSEIEEVYKNFYPRKEGKTRGLQKLVKEIKTESDLESFRLAVQNYAQKVITDKIGQKYVKMFSTFAHEWKDYLDDSYNTPNIAKNYERVTLKDILG